MIGSFCLLVVFSIFSLIITSCNYCKRQQIISEKVLRDKIQSGEITKLIDLINTNSGTICMLYPYQEEIRDEIPDKDRLNDHLKKMQYYSDEGDWSFVFIEGDTINVSRYTTSKKINILAEHQLRNEHRMQLPIGFKPAETNCLPIARASVTKVELDNREYIIMGEIR